MPHHSSRLSRVAEILKEISEIQKNQPKKTQDPNTQDESLNATDFISEDLTKPPQYDFLKGTPLERDQGSFVRDVPWANKWKYQEPKDPSLNNLDKALSSPYTSYVNLDQKKKVGFDKMDTVVKITGKPGTPAYNKGIELAIAGGMNLHQDANNNVYGVLPKAPKPLYEIFTPEGTFAKPEETFWKNVKNNWNQTLDQMHLGFWTMLYEDAKRDNGVGQAMLKKILNTTDKVPPVLLASPMGAPAFLLAAFSDTPKKKEDKLTKEFLEGRIAENRADLAESQEYTQWYQPSGPVKITDAWNNPHEFFSISMPTVLASTIDMAWHSIPSIAIGGAVGGPGGSMAAGIVSSTISRYHESMIEAGGVFEEALYLLEQNRPELTDDQRREMAYEEAGKVFNRQMWLLAADVPQLAFSLSPWLSTSKTIARGIGRGMRKLAIANKKLRQKHLAKHTMGTIAVTSLIEGGEEGTQYWMNETSLNEFRNEDEKKLLDLKGLFHDEEFWGSFTSGALSGGVMNSAYMLVGEGLTKWKGRRLDKADIQDLENLQKVARSVKVAGIVMGDQDISAIAWAQNLAEKGMFTANTEASLEERIKESKENAKVLEDEIDAKREILSYINGKRKKIKGKKNLEMAFINKALVYDTDRDISELLNKGVDANDIEIQELKEFRDNANQIYESILNGADLANKIHPSEVKNGPASVEELSQMAQEANKIQETVDELIESGDIVNAYNGIMTELSALIPKGEQVIVDPVTGVPMTAVELMDRMKEESSDGQVSVEEFLERRIKHGAYKSLIEAKTELENVLLETQQGESISDMSELLMQAVSEETETKTSKTVNEALSEKGSVYEKDGKEGTITTDPESSGQAIIFETDDTIEELGNKEEMGEKSLEELGITQVDRDVNIIPNEDGTQTIEFNGKQYQNKYSEPTSAITQNKDGSYSVTLDDENGNKRTFRGQNGEYLAYQILQEKMNGPVTDEKLQEIENRLNEYENETAKQGETSSTEKTDNEQTSQDTNEQESTDTGFRAKRRRKAKKDKQVKKDLKDEKPTEDTPAEETSEKDVANEKDYVTQVNEDGTVSENTDMGFKPVSKNETHKLNPKEVSDELSERISSGQTIEGTIEDETLDSKIPETRDSKIKRTTGKIFTFKQNGKEYNVRVYQHKHHLKKYDPKKKTKLKVIRPTKEDVKKYPVTRTDALIVIDRVKKFQSNINHPDPNAKTETKQNYYKILGKLYRRVSEFASGKKTPTSTLLAGANVGNIGDYIGREVINELQKRIHEALNRKPTDTKKIVKDKAIQKTINQLKKDLLKKYTDNSTTPQIEQNTSDETTVSKPLNEIATEQAIKNAINGYVQIAEDLIIDQNLYVVTEELTIHNDQFRLAGTTDIVAITPDGKLRVYDLKSRNNGIKGISNKGKNQEQSQKDGYLTQVNTYGFMYQETYGIEYDGGGLYVTQPNYKDTGFVSDEQLDTLVLKDSKYSGMIPVVKEDPKGIVGNTRQVGNNNKWTEENLGKYRVVEKDGELFFEFTQKEYRGVYYPYIVAAVQEEVTDSGTVTNVVGTLQQRSSKDYDKTSKEPQTEEAQMEEQAPIKNKEELTKILLEADSTSLEAFAKDIGVSDKRLLWLLRAIDKFGIVYPRVVDNRTDGVLGRTRISRNDNGNIDLIQINLYTQIADSDLIEEFGWDIREKLKETFYHELIHAYIKLLIDPVVGKKIAKILGVPQVSEKVDRKLKDLTKEVKKRISQSKKKDEFDSLDPFLQAILDSFESDTMAHASEELVTYAFTFKPFAEWLNSQPASKKYEKQTSLFDNLTTLWHQFLDVISVALNKVNPTLLTELVQIMNTKNDVSEQGVEKQAQHLILQKKVELEKLLLDADDSQAKMLQYEIDKLELALKRKDLSMSDYDEINTAINIVLGGVLDGDTRSINEYYSVIPTNKDAVKKYVQEADKYEEIIEDNSSVIRQSLAALIGQMQKAYKRRKEGETSAKHVDKFTTKNAIQYLESLAPQMEWAENNLGEALYGIAKRYEKFGGKISSEAISRIELSIIDSYMKEDDEQTEVDKGTGYMVNNANIFRKKMKAYLASTPGMSYDTVENIMFELTRNKENVKDIPQLVRQMQESPILTHRKLGKHLALLETITPNLISGIFNNYINLSIYPALNYSNERSNQFSVQTVNSHMGEKRLIQSFTEFIKQSIKILEKDPKGYQQQFSNYNKERIRLVSLFNQLEGSEKNREEANKVLLDIKKSDVGFLNAITQGGGNGHLMTTNAELQNNIHQTLFNWEHYLNAKNNLIKGNKKDKNYYLNYDEKLLTERNPAEIPIYDFILKTRMDKNHNVLYAPNTLKDLLQNLIEKPPYAVNPKNYRLNQAQVITLARGAVKMSEIALDKRYQSVTFNTQDAIHSNSALNNVIKNILTSEMSKEVKNSSYVEHYRKLNAIPQMGVISGTVSKYRWKKAHVAKDFNIAEYLDLWATSYYMEDNENIGDNEYRFIMPQMGSNDKVVWISAPKLTTNQVVTKWNELQRRMEEYGLNSEILPEGDVEILSNGEIYLSGKIKEDFKLFNDLLLKSNIVTTEKSNNREKAYLTLMLHYAEITEMVMGSPANFMKDGKHDHITLTKRKKGMISPGVNLPSNFTIKSPKTGKERNHIRHAVLSDSEAVLNELEDIGLKNDEIPTTDLEDGVVFMSPTMSKAYNEAMGFIHGNDNVQKMNVLHTDKDGNGFYIKGQHWTLTEDLANSTKDLDGEYSGKLKELYDYMQKNDIDVLVMKSAAKVLGKNKNENVSELNSAAKIIELPPSSTYRQISTERDAVTHTLSLRSQIKSIILSMPEGKRFMNIFNHIYDNQVQNLTDRFLNASEESKKEEIIRLLANINEDDPIIPLLKNGMKLNNPTISSLVDKLIQSKIEKDALDMAVKGAIYGNFPGHFHALEYASRKNDKNTSGEVMVPYKHRNAYPEGSKLIVIRTPSTGGHSMQVSTVKGYAHKDLGNTMPLNTRAIAENGSDFDGDSNSTMTKFTGDNLTYVQKSINTIIDLVIDYAENGGMESYNRMHDPIKIKKFDSPNESIPTFSMENIIRARKNNVEGSKAIGVMARGMVNYIYLGKIGARINPLLTFTHKGEVVNDFTYNQDTQSMLASNTNYAVDNENTQAMIPIGMRLALAGEFELFTMLKPKNISIDKWFDIRTALFTSDIVEEIINEVDKSSDLSKEGRISAKMALGSESSIYSLAVQAYDNFNIEDILTETNSSKKNKYIKSILAKLILIGDEMWNLHNVIAAQEKGKTEATIGNVLVAQRAYKWLTNNTTERYYINKSRAYKEDTPQLIPAFESYIPFRDNEHYFYEAADLTNRILDYKAKNNIEYSLMGQHLIERFMEQNSNVPATSINKFVAAVKTMFTAIALEEDFKSSDKFPGTGKENARANAIKVLKALRADPNHKDNDFLSILTIDDVDGREEVNLKWEYRTNEESNFRMEHHREQFDLLPKTARQALILDLAHRNLLGGGLTGPSFSRYIGIESHKMIDVATSRFKTELNEQSNVYKVGEGDSVTPTKATLVLEFLIYVNNPDLAQFLTSTAIGGAKKIVGYPSKNYKLSANFVQAPFRKSTWIAYKTKNSNLLEDSGRGIEYSLFQDTKQWEAQNKGYDRSAALAKKDETILDISPVNRKIEKQAEHITGKKEIEVIERFNDTFPEANEYFITSTKNQYHYNDIRSLITQTKLIENSHQQLDLIANEASAYLSALPNDNSIKKKLYQLFHNENQLVTRDRVADLIKAISQKPDELKVIGLWEQKPIPATIGGRKKAETVVRDFWNEVSHIFDANNLDQGKVDKLFDRELWQDNYITPNQMELNWEEITWDEVHDSRIFSSKNTSKEESGLTEDQDEMAESNKGKIALIEDFLGNLGYKLSKLKGGQLLQAIYGKFDMNSNVWENVIKNAGHIILDDDGKEKAGSWKTILSLDSYSRNQFGMSAAEMSVKNREFLEESYNAYSDAMAELTQFMVENKRHKDLFNPKKNTVSDLIDMVNDFSEFREIKIVNGIIEAVENVVFARMAADKLGRELKEPIHLPKPVTQMMHSVLMPKTNKDAIQENYQNAVMRIMTSPMNIRNKTAQLHRTVKNTALQKAQITTALIDPRIKDLAKKLKKLKIITKQQAIDAGIAKIIAIDFDKDGNPTDSQLHFVSPYVYNKKKKKYEANPDYEKLSQKKKDIIDTHIETMWLISTNGHKERNDHEYKVFATSYTARRVPQVAETNLERMFSRAKKDFKSRGLLEMFKNMYFNLYEIRSSKVEHMLDVHVEDIQTGRKITLGDMYEKLDKMYHEGEINRTKHSALKNKYYKQAKKYYVNAVKDDAIMFKDTAGVYHKMPSSSVKGRQGFTIKEDSSENLMIGIGKYYQHEILSNELTPVLPMLGALKNMIGKEDEHLLKLIKSHEKRDIYGTPLEPEQPVWKKILQFGIKFTAFQLLGFNWAGAGINLSAGIFRNLWDGGMYHTMKGLRRLIWLSEIDSSDSTEKQLPMKAAFNFIRNMGVIYTQVNLELQKNKSLLNKATDVATVITYSNITIPEYIVQGITVLGKMSKKELSMLNPDGTLKPGWEKVFTIDRVLQLLDTTSQYHGGYHPYSKRTVNSYVLGSAFMQMKNWLPEIFNAHFQAMSESGYGVKTEGVFTAAFRVGKEATEKEGMFGIAKYMMDYVTYLINRIKSINKSYMPIAEKRKLLKHLSTHDAKIMSKLARELLLMAAFTMLIAEMSEDEEKESPLIAYMKRQLADITFVLSPRNWEFLLEYPMPSISLYTDILRMMDQMYSIQERGPEKFKQDTEPIWSPIVGNNYGQEGDPKWVKTLFDNVLPLSNIPRSYKRIEELVTNESASTSKKKKPSKSRRGVRQYQRRKPYERK